MKFDYENKTDTLNFKLELFFYILYTAMGLFIGFYSYYSWLSEDLLLAITAGIFWPLTLIFYAVLSGINYIWGWLNLF